jgi:S-DNA-T family DNA segregation ATPase FtsK/SpoIIIE
MNDPLYNEIRKYVQKQDKISVSYLQRKFKIGYNRASKIVECLEDNGTVSLRDKYGFRTVLKRIYVWSI